MHRQTSAAVIAELKRAEGLPGTDGVPALKAYRDSGGVPTIGWGHTRGVAMGMVCTPAQAERWLDQDLDLAEKTVATLVRVPLDDWQFGALVSFVFNVGVEGFRTSTLLRLLNQGRYDAVPAQLMRWVKDEHPKTKKKVTVPGLVNRRAAEVRMWNHATVLAAVPRPAPPPPTDRLLATSTGRKQAAALTAGGVAAGLEATRATPALIDGLREAMPQLESLSYLLDSAKVLLVGGTLVLIGWTLYERWQKTREGA